MTSRAGLRKRMRLQTDPATLCVLILLSMVAGCRTAPSTRNAAPAIAPPRAGSISEFAASIKADSARSDHESDARARADLAADASRNAEACLAAAPQAAACLYGRALALGLEARAHPTHAGESLNDMLQFLGRADAADPNYDDAGPSRVRALVLLKAPGWPLGPGDPDAGLEAARRAVTLRPEFPPNQLALAEAQAKTGDAAGAQATYTRARQEAMSLPPSPDRDDWLRAADQGLQHR